MLGIEDMWNIREVREEDIAAIASLITVLGYQTTAEEMRNRMQRIVGDPQYLTLVATDGTRVVGVLGLAFGLYYEYSGSYARIVALSVTPDMQGKGIGSKLVAAAEEIARSRGAITCIVNSGLHREQTHKFYESLGFSWRSKAFYKPIMIADTTTANPSDGHCSR